MASLQPKIKSKVRCEDAEVGEIVHVIADPLSLEVSHVLGALIGLPLVWPVLRFIMKPMYAPYDDHWIKIGNISKIKTEDVGVQFIIKKAFRDSVLQREEDKNHWVVRASPETLKKI